MTDGLLPLEKFAAAVLAGLRAGLTPEQILAAIPLCRGGEAVTARAPLDLDWFTGCGPYLAVSHCRDEPTGTRHATQAAAYQALDHWDLYGCGPHCRLRHTVTHQPDRATTH